MALSQSYVWRGYFKPDANSTSWQFRTTSKDGSYFWLDTNAENPVASLNPSDAIVDNAGIHPLTTVESSNQSLSSEFYYVVTLIAGNNASTGSVTLEWRRDGDSWSSSGASYLSHDSRYPDGLGEDLYTASVAPVTRWAVASGKSSDNQGKFYYLSNDTITAATTNNSAHDWLGGYNIWGVQNRTARAIRALGYGKNASGNGIYIAAQTSHTANEFAIQSGSAVEVVAGDPPGFADVNPWTLVDVTGSNSNQVQIFDVVWGADSGGAAAGTWMAVGEQSSDQAVYRSRDGGQNWQAITVPSGDSSVDVFTIASNGSGTWAFVHDDGFYLSTDDGATFTKSTPFTMSIGNGIGYNKSNNTWIVSYFNSGAYRVRTCSGTDFTTWSDETTITGTAGTFDDVATVGHFVRAYNGRVMIQPYSKANKASRIAILDVNGTSISNLDTIQLGNNSNSKPIRCSATDGTTWLIGTRGGDIFKSSDNAETWVKITDSLQGPTSPNYAVPHIWGSIANMAMAADVYYPLD